jgi:hypothetical protein
MIIFDFLLIGDYGISRSMGITMTMGVGTECVLEYSCFIYLIKINIYLYFFNK